jgi:hypothetical protein
MVAIIYMSLSMWSFSSKSAIAFAQVLMQCAVLTSGFKKVEIQCIHPLVRMVTTASGVTSLLNNDQPEFPIVVGELVNKRLYDKALI